MEDKRKCSHNRLIRDNTVAVYATGSKGPGKHFSDFRSRSMQSGYFPCLNLIKSLPVTFKNSTAAVTAKAAPQASDTQDS